MKHKIYLILDFAKRDLQQRYVGTGLGSLWFILSPIIMIFIYSVVFSDFMKMKLNIVDNSYAYSIYLIPGILAWTSFSTIIIRLTNSFFDNANLIKKVNIPMYIIQLSIVLAEFITFFISMFLGIIFLILVNQPINLNFLYILPVMLLQTIFAFALGVIFSLFTPFLKDIKEIVPIILQLWFWMTPIIYVKDLISNKYPFLITINPIYYYIKIYQNIFLYAKASTLTNILIITLLSLSTLTLAAYLYKKMVASIKDII